MELITECYSVGDALEKELVKTFVMLSTDVKLKGQLVQTVTELIPDWLGPIQPIFLWQPTDRFFILRFFQNLILKVRTTIWTVFLLSLRR